MISVALVLLVIAPVSRTACLQVPGSEILARDLARANVLLSSVPPGAVFGFAPAPGARRVLRSRELAAFARDNGVELEGRPLASLCVERQAAPLRGADLQSALAKAAEAREARIELVDYSRQPVPNGELEFHWNALHAPAGAALDTPVIWRGRIHYDPQHSLAIWAKVRISVERPVVIANVDLAPGHSIEPQQIRIAHMNVFPLGAGTVDAIEPVIGKTVSRVIRRGQPVLESLLREPDDVTAGERVQVRVVDGSANLSFEGTALAGGRKGATITLRNPASGRIFRGTIEAEGCVLVRSGGPA